MNKRFPTNRSSVLSAMPKPEFLPLTFDLNAPSQIPCFTRSLRIMEVPEVKRLKSPEEENTRLRKLLAGAKCWATGLSQRRAGRLAGLSLIICRQSAQRPAADAQLSLRITELAPEPRRFGYMAASAA